MTQGPKDASTDSTEDKSWIPKVALGFWEQHWALCYFTTKSKAR